MSGDGGILSLIGRRQKRHDGDGDGAFCFKLKSVGGS